MIDFLKKLLELLVEESNNIIAIAAVVSLAVAFVGNLISSISVTTIDKKMLMTTKE